MSLKKSFSRSAGRFLCTSLTMISGTRRRNSSDSSIRMRTRSSNLEDGLGPGAVSSPRMYSLLSKMIRIVLFPNGFPGSPEFLDHLILALSYEDPPSLTYLQTECFQTCCIGIPLARLRVFLPHEEIYEVQYLC